MVEILIQNSIFLALPDYNAAVIFDDTWKNFRVETTMKHKYFYLYQSADIIFTSSCRAIGMLLAWIMIQHYHLKVELGWFISTSWILQVLTLILMGFFLIE